MQCTKSMHEKYAKTLKQKVEIYANFPTEKFLSKVIIWAGSVFITWESFLLHFNLWELVKLVRKVIHWEKPSFDPLRLVFCMLIDRLNSEELNFLLWRFLGIKIGFPIQWAMLNLMIWKFWSDSLGVRF